MNKIIFGLNTLLEQIKAAAKFIGSAGKNYLFIIPRYALVEGYINERSGSYLYAFDGSAEIFKVVDLDICDYTICIEIDKLIKLFETAVKEESEITSLHIEELEDNKIELVFTNGKEYRLPVSRKSELRGPNSIKKGVLFQTDVFLKTIDIVSSAGNPHANMFTNINMKLSKDKKKAMFFCANKTISSFAIVDVEDIGKVFDIDKDNLSIMSYETARHLVKFSNALFPERLKDNINIDFSHNPTVSISNQEFICQSTPETLDIIRDSGIIFNEKTKNNNQLCIIDLKESFNNIKELFSKYEEKVRTREGFGKVFLSTKPGKLVIGIVFHDNTTSVCELATDILPDFQERVEIVDFRNFYYFLTACQRKNVEYLKLFNCDSSIIFETYTNESLLIFK